MVISTIPNNRSAKSTVVDSSLFADMDRHRRKWFGCQSFGCFALIMLIALLIGALALVAASGVATIPGLSGWLYAAAPTPIRTVTATPINLAALTAAADINGTSASVDLSEAQLSGLVSADQLPMFRAAQLTADPTDLVFFGTYVRMPIGNPVTIRLAFVPSVTAQGSLTCTVTQLMIGYVPVPTALVSGLVPLVCNQLSSELQVSGASLKSITLDAGKVTLTESITPPAPAAK